MPFEVFKRGVGSLALRGTAVLFRTDATFRKTEKLVYNPIDEGVTTIAELMGKHTRDRIKCSTCAAKNNYTLALHTLVLCPNDTFKDPIQIKEEDTKRKTKVARR